LKGGDLHAETVRQAIRNSQSFTKAIGKAKGKIDIVKPVTSGMVVTLSGSVEREKLENAKRLVKAENGLEDITNADLVRYMVDHIIRCLGVPVPEESDKQVN